MKRSWLVSIVVVAGVVVVVGLGLLIAPYVMHPGASGGARSALDAYRGAGSATVRIEQPADGEGSVQVDGTVHRSTGADEASGRFAQIAYTDVYRNVQVRRTGGKTYTKNFDSMGSTPWVRLQTNGGDDASVAMQLADPVKWLTLADSYKSRTTTERRGLFGRHYSTSCYDCTVDLGQQQEQQEQGEDDTDLYGSGPGSDAGPGAGSDAGQGGDSDIAPPQVTISFDVDPRGRPTRIWVLAGDGQTDTSVELLIGDYGAPVSVRPPSGATPSPTPVRY